MHYVNAITNAICDSIVSSWMGTSIWTVLTVVSLLVALLMVALFKISSNQESLKSARNRMIARTLELHLYRHDARVSLTACGRILQANIWYLAAFARPLLIAIVPMLLIFAQMAAWFEYRPLRVGETSIVEIELERSQSVSDASVDIAASPSLAIDSVGVRVPLTNTISWRIRPLADGDGWIDLTRNGVTERKTCSVGQGIIKLSPRKTARDAWQQTLYPVEPTLDRESSLVRIDVLYPHREWTIGDMKIHWIVSSILIMIIGGLIMGKIFGVNLA